MVYILVQNRAWTMSDEIQEYEERVKAARSELQILQDTHTQLTEKLVGANSLNETLQQRLEQAQVDAATAKTEHDETVGDLQDVEAQIHALNQELAVLRPKAEDATARLGAARSKLESDEQRLKEQLAQAEAQAKRREQELTVRIKQQREALEATRQEADELANIAMVGGPVAWCTRGCGHRFSLVCVAVCVCGCMAICCDQPRRTNS